MFKLLHSPNIGYLIFYAYFSNSGKKTLQRDSSWQLSLFIYPVFIPNLHGFLSSAEHKRWWYHFHDHWLPFYRQRKHWGFSQFIFFMFHRRKSVIQVWNNMRVNKLLVNIHFWILLRALTLEECFTFKSSCHHLLVITGQLVSDVLHNIISDSFEEISVAGDNEKHRWVRHCMVKNIGALKDLQQTRLYTQSYAAIVNDSLPKNWEGQWNSN